jgi:hypothetical protein
VFPGKNVHSNPNPFHLTDARFIIAPVKKSRRFRVRVDRESGTLRSGTPSHGTPLIDFAGEVLAMKKSIKMLTLTGRVAVGLFAQSTPDTVAGHRAAAIAAAGTDHKGVVDAACPPEAPPEARPPYAAGRAGGRAPAATPRPDPPRDQCYAEPVKVFDNLYFVGTKAHGAWAVTTSDGIIVIDALFGYAVKAEVDEGLRKLGLDPKNIK